uniref:ketopantoate reductase family protein n=1 Tax=Hylemonella sp. TaxID=2066020 RepID=UPI0035B277C9
MNRPSRILILGASYGSLLGIKLVMAGHRVTLVCLPQEVELINREGIHVRLPLKGREGLVELRSQDASGQLRAAGPAEVIPADYELVALAMQEPQYRSPGVRDLLQAVAKSRVPCMSIMNMPPLPYLARLPGVDATACRGAYTDPTVWDGFDPACMTLCSPDPQAFRPPEEALNVLQVRLPTNFKVAGFPSETHTGLLRRLQADIEAIRHTVDGEAVELPVKLKVHDSVFVPLAKWAMLLAGNYRCVTAQGVRSIREAVHTDLQAAREVYDWVCALCKSLGAAEADLVPFEKYAAAAQGLASPSSAARALYAGAPHIERVDRLVQAIAAQRGLRHPAVDEVVALVDAQLERNRAAQK